MSIDSDFDADALITLLAGSLSPPDKTSHSFTKNNVYVTSTYVYLWIYTIAL
jgi:hypothetical protein